MKKSLLAAGCLVLVAAAMLAQARAAAKKKPPAPSPENVREIKITGKYLIFPVSNKGRRGRMAIHVGEHDDAHVN